MANRQRIQEIPSTLRLTLEKAHAEYGAAVRKVRWGDGPLFVCGAGSCAALGLAASYAFETFLGWPVVARPVEAFQNYGMALLRPRSVLLMVSAKGEWPEAQELAESAQERGCTVVALANAPDNPLVKSADHVFLVQAEGDGDLPAVVVCMHAALNFLAFEVMRMLKRPQPHWDLMEEEFHRLPEKIEWVFTQLSEAVRSLTIELTQVSRLRIVGGGFYYYPAWQGAWHMQSLSVPQVGAVGALEFLSAHSLFARRDDAVLLLSGSHSKIRKLLHRCAVRGRASGARVLSLTDADDRDLAESSDVGILIPSLLEVPASTLAMFMLEWLAWEMARATKPHAPSR